MPRPQLALGLFLVLASACKDEPAADPAPTSTEETKTDDAKTGDAKTGEPGPDDIEATDGKSGLAGLTKDLVDQARRTTSETTRLVPASAEYLVRMRVAELLAYGPATELWRKAEDTEEEFRTAVDVMVACMARLEVFEELTVGFDSDEHKVLIAHAVGLGKDDTWRCFQEKTVGRGKTWDMQITGTPRGEGPQLLTDDGNRGYLPDDDTLVLVSKEWDAEVSALLAGEGTPAVEGPLAGPVARVPADSPLWLAGRVGAKASAGLEGSPFAGMTDISFSLRIEDEQVSVSTSIDAGEAADATRMKDELTTQFAQFEGMLPMFGFPSTVGPKIVFETEGDLVSLDFTLTKSEIDGIRGGIERTF